MGRVRIVWGSSRGPTALSAYDAALAAANVHDYNVVHVSSVLPAGANVDPVGTAPDLGPVGERLTVVEARETAAVETGRPAAPPDADTDAPADASTDTDASVEGNPPADAALGDTDGPVVRAGLGWAQAPNGRGIVYEATGTESDDVHRAIETGLRAGCTLRDLSSTDTDRALDRRTHQASRHRRRSAGRPRGRSGPRLDGCRSAGRLGTRPRGWRRSRRNR